MVLDGVEIGGRGKKWQKEEIDRLCQCRQMYNTAVLI